MNTLPSTHWSFLRRALGALALCGFVGASVMFAQSANQPGGEMIPGRNVTGTLTPAGTVNLRQIAAANKLKPVNTAGPEFKRAVPVLQPPRRPSSLTPGSLSASSTLSNLFSPAPEGVILNFGQSTGFTGLTHFDQRTANGGNQFSVEPPDQALAVGNGFVVEGVNEAFNIYSTAGVPQLAAPVTANQFFNLPPNITRPFGSPFGPFLSDPVVVFDSTTNRFFAIMGDIESTDFGFLLASTRLRIAVSQSDDPTGAWTIFTLDTTDANNPDGQGTRLPDYEKISFDENGVYITANEFQIFPGEVFGNFIGVSIRAISKSALEEVNRIAPPPVVEFELRFNAAAPASQFSFTVHPAKTAPGEPFSSALGGLQYFVSSDAVTSTTGNQVAVWTLFNTSSLKTNKPSLGLKKSVVSTLTYALPTVPVVQKPGPFPLGMSLGEPEETLDASVGDDRIQSVDFAHGQLYATLETQTVNSLTHKPEIAAALFILKPTSTNATAFTLAGQTVIRQNGVSLLRPAVGVNKSGIGAIVFTLVGPTNFPSSAFIPFNTHGFGPIVTQAPGQKPEDGFTGYPEFGGDGTARWGDYSWATVSDADQSTIFMGTEYIPNLPRTSLANWATFVTKYIPNP